MGNLMVRRNCASQIIPAVRYWICVENIDETRKDYSQLEMKGLTCIFSVKHFHSYLFGHKLVLQTNHQLLTTPFNKSKVSLEVQCGIE